MRNVNMFIHATENGKRIFDVLLSVTLQRMFKGAVVKEDEVRAVIGDCLATGILVRKCDK